MDKDLILKKIKKYPYLGSSPNLIENFLIIGFEKSTKTEIINDIKEEILKVEIQESEYQGFQKLKRYFIERKPEVLNNISSDFSESTIDGDLIVKYFFPDLTQIYYNKGEKIEPNNQNIIFYLSADKLTTKEPNDNEQKIEAKLNDHNMFNVFGYLFWESPLKDKSKDEEIRDKKSLSNFKFFFPKIIVFISQYSHFRYFSILAQNILFRLRKSSFEIPLEIQIYNIVNFTPSPIHCDLKLNLLANYDIIDMRKMYKENEFEIIKKNDEDGNENCNDPNKDNQIILPQLSGIPYFDIDLSYLFSYFNFESFFTTYIFSFLEFKTIFFSPNLNFLNTIMYIIRFLSYPFIDINDNGQIYSISKEEFLNGGEIKNNIIGVNCIYDPSFVIPNCYNNYFIISFNSLSIDIYFNKKSINSLNVDQANTDEIKEIIKLMKYIEDSVKINEGEEKVYNNFLDKRLYSMYDALYHCFKNIMNINVNFNNNNKENLNDFFIELKLDESNFRTYNYKYDIFDDHNSTIQKAFYNFNLNIYEFFYERIKLSSGTKEKSKNKFEISSYDIEINEYKDKKALCDQDKIFLKFFQKTSKYRQFYELFFKNNISCDLNKPSLIIAEEFLNARKAYGEYRDNKNYIQVINTFYQNSDKIRIVDFLKFNIFFAENACAKQMYDIILDSKIYDARNNKGRYIYRQKEKDCTLDNNAIKRYAYILNNIEQNELIKLFPSLDFKLKQNIIEEIKTTDFADILENELLEEKFTKFEEIAIEIVLIIYFINIKKKNIMFHFFEEIFPFLDDFLQYQDPNTQKMTEKKINFINFRKYIYLILLILNDQVKDKLNNKANCTKELLIYQEIINTILNLNAKKHKKDISQTICLNERFIAIINNFDQYQKTYERFLNEDNNLEKESSEIVQKYYQFNRDESEENPDLLEEGVHYKVLLINNACRCKRADNVFLTICDALDYKGHIMTTCKTCSLRIKPSLFFVHDSIYKSENIGFYSLFYIYKTCKEMLRIILDKGINSVKEKNYINNELFTIIGNMIFYLNYKKGPFNKISRYLATSLVKT
mgnify:CR=1 FL=1